MKKISVMFFVLILALFCAACGSTTSKDNTDCEVNEDCVDTTVDTDSGDDPDSGADSGSETGDTTPGGDTDPSDTTPGGNTGTDDGDTVPDIDTECDSVICEIQTDQLAEGAEVTVNECVVTGIEYNSEKRGKEYVNLSIKGFYVSEIIKKAKPYSGIYIYTKEADVDAYTIGEKLAVTGIYKEFNGNSQIAADENGKITKLGTAELPEPAEIEDLKTIATPFEQQESAVNEQCKEGWTPNSAMSGEGAEPYEGVLVKIKDAEITNRNLCYGIFEVNNTLAIGKNLYYYSGNKKEGKKFDSIQGILIYDYEAFKLAPTKAEDLVESEDSGDTDPTSHDGGDTGSAEIEFETTTIKAVQKGEVAAKTLVKIENAIVISPVFEETKGSNTMYSFFVSDGTTGDYSGLYIYRLSAEAAPAKGDKVSVEGQVTSFKPTDTADQTYEYSQWQIKPQQKTGSVAKTGTEAVPEVAEKAVAELKESDKGTYVKITDELTVASVDDKGKVTFTNGFIAEGFGDVKLSFAENDKVKLSGIYDVVYGELGIFVIDANDIVKK